MSAASGGAADGGTPFTSFSGCASAGALAAHPQGLSVDRAAADHKDRFDRLGVSEEQLTGAHVRRVRAAGRRQPGGRPACGRPAQGRRSARKPPSSRSGFATCGALVEGMVWPSGWVCVARTREHRASVVPPRARWPSQQRCSCRSRPSRWGWRRLRHSVDPQAGASSLGSTATSSAP
eukprot:scaffold156478_cov28-Tisochrysis_lutea.AAC.1